MKKEKNSKNDTKLKFLDQNKENKQENFEYQDEH